jgi:hypothetical protein
MYDNAVIKVISYNFGALIVVALVLNNSIVTAIINLII